MTTQLLNRLTAAGWKPWPEGDGAERAGTEGTAGYLLYACWDVEGVTVEVWRDKQTISRHVLEPLQPEIAEVLIAHADALLALEDGPFVQDALGRGLTVLCFPVQEEDVVLEAERLEGDTFRWNRIVDEPDPEGEPE